MTLVSVSARQTEPRTSVSGMRTRPFGSGDGGGSAAPGNAGISRPKNQQGCRFQRAWRAGRRPWGSPVGIITFRGSGAGFIGYRLLTCAARFGTACRAARVSTLHLPQPPRGHAATKDQVIATTVASLRQNQAAELFFRARLGRELRRPIVEVLQPRTGVVDHDLVVLL